MTKSVSFDDSHSVIKCSICGKDRTIRNQDKHQVDKCKECQYDHRLKRRKELRDKKKLEESLSE